MRCIGSAIRSDWRRTSAVCSNAITCALCGPGRCSIRRRRRAWRRSPSGSRRCTRCSARMSCTTRTSGASCSTKPTSTGCRNSPAPPLPLLRSERGLAGKYVITLARASVEPFLAFSSRRDLRRTAYEAWAARGAHPGAHDNRPLIGEIMRLRAEQAKLLGYRDLRRLPARRCDGENAGGRRRACCGRSGSRPAARLGEERAELAEAALEDGLNEQIAPWDWRYYAEKVRQRNYALDEAELKPFFVLDNMVQAAFDTAGQLFGISFVERRDCELYHPDVRA